jgi:hypothetical protein
MSSSWNFYLHNYFRLQQFDYIIFYTKNKNQQGAPISNTSITEFEINCFADCSEMIKLAVCCDSLSERTTFFWERESSASVSCYRIQSIVSHSYIYNGNILPSLSPTPTPFVEYNVSSISGGVDWGMRGIPENYLQAGEETKSYVLLKHN